MKKILEYLNKSFTKVKDLYNKYKFGLMIFAFLSIFIKSMIFIGLTYSSDANMILGISNDFVVFIQSIFALILVIPALLFKEKGRNIYCIIITILISVIYILDISYYRASWTLYSFKYLFIDGLFNPFNRELINIRAIDILFVIDLPFMISIFLLKNRKKNKNVVHKSFKVRAIATVLLISVCVSTIAMFQYLISEKNFGKGRYTLFDTYWSPHATIKCIGPIGFHLLDVYRSYEKNERIQSVNEDEIEEAKSWLKYNDENLPNNEYFGMFKDKNVILVQMESYEEFLLNKSVYGQEITPNLNRLLKNSFNFNNIYEQNNGGNSIDCDILVNASVFTLGDSITGLTNEEVKFKTSLQRILEKNGYSTASAKAEKGEDWNWGELHKNGFGVQHLWDEKNFDMSDLVGFGLSDESMMNQFREMTETLKEPFMSFTVTLTTHGPFDLNEELKELDLPESLNENLLGKYFQAIHYSDKQLGKFIDDLDKDGVLDDTVVVFYGDHGGVHKYYNDKIQDAELEGDWWREYEKKIPLIIYSKGMEGKTIEAPGGQVDIYPTLAYLLGIDKNEYIDGVMGRNLLNTNRTATVIKGNEIKGVPSSEEEKNHLLNAYNVGRIIIENNMLK